MAIKNAPATCINTVKRTKKEKNKKTKTETCDIYFYEAIAYVIFIIHCLLKIIHKDSILFLKVKQETFFFFKLVVRTVSLKYREGNYSCVFKEKVGGENIQAVVKFLPSTTL